jgi:tRNA (cmo5U34)-methyltransferase
VRYEERLRTLREVQRRLKPGAPFVIAHLSLPLDDAERATWLSRYVSFSVDSGADPDKAAHAATTVGSQLPILSPEQDEALLRAAGFTNVSLFYVGFAFRGWVAYAAT